MIMGNHYTTLEGSGKTPINQHHHHHHYHHHHHHHHLPILEHSSNDLCHSNHSSHAIKNSGGVNGKDNVTKFEHPHQLHERRKQHYHQNSHHRQPAQLVAVYRQAAPHLVDSSSLDQLQHPIVCEAPPPYYESAVHNHLTGSSQSSCNTRPFVADPGNQSTAVCCEACCFPAPPDGNAGCNTPSLLVEACQKYCNIAEDNPLLDKFWIYGNVKCAKTDNSVCYCRSKSEDLTCTNEYENCDNNQIKINNTNNKNNTANNSTEKTTDFVNTYNHASVGIKCFFNKQHSHDQCQLSQELMQRSQCLFTGINPIYNRTEKLSLPAIEPLNVAEEAEKLASPNLIETFEAHKDSQFERIRQPGNDAERNPIAYNVGSDLSKNVHNSTDRISAQSCDREKTYRAKPISPSRIGRPSEILDGIVKRPRCQLHHIQVTSEPTITGTAVNLSPNSFCRQRALRQSNDRKSSEKTSPTHSFPRLSSDKYSNPHLNFGRKYSLRERTSEIVEQDFSESNYGYTREKRNSLAPVSVTSCNFNFPEANDNGLPINGQSICSAKRIWRSCSNGLSVLSCFQRIKSLQRQSTNVPTHSSSMTNTQEQMQTTVNRNPSSTSCRNTTEFNTGNFRRSGRRALRSFCECPGLHKIHDSDSFYNLSVEPSVRKLERSSTSAESVIDPLTLNSTHVLSSKVNDLLSSGLTSDNSNNFCCPDIKMAEANRLRQTSESLTDKSSNRTAIDKAKSLKRLCIPIEFSRDINIDSHLAGFGQRTHVNVPANDFDTTSKNSHASPVANHVDYVENLIVDSVDGKSKEEVVKSKFAYKAKNDMGVDNANFRSSLSSMDSELLMAMIPASTISPASSRENKPAPLDQTKKISNQTTENLFPIGSYNATNTIRTTAPCSLDDWEHTSSMTSSLTSLVTSTANSTFQDALLEELEREMTAPPPPPRAMPPWLKAALLEKYKQNCPSARQLSQPADFKLSRISKTPLKQTIDKELNSVVPSDQPIIRGLKQLSMTPQLVDANDNKLYCSLDLFTSIKGRSKLQGNDDNYQESTIGIYPVLQNGVKVSNTHYWILNRPKRRKHRRAFTTVGNCEQIPSNNRNLANSAKEPGGQEISAMTYGNSKSLNWNMSSTVTTAVSPSIRKTQDFNWKTFHRSENFPQISVANDAQKVSDLNYVNYSKYQNSTQKNNSGLMSDLKLNDKDVNTTNTLTYSSNDHRHGNLLSHRLDNKNVDYSRSRSSNIESIEVNGISPDKGCSQLVCPSDNVKLRRGQSEISKESMHTYQRGQILRLRYQVPEANEQECYAVLVGSNWEFHEAVHRLKIELLCREHSNVSRSHCQRVLSQCDWNLQHAVDLIRLDRIAKQHRQLSRKRKDKHDSAPTTPVSSQPFQGKSAGSHDQIDFKNTNVRKFTDRGESCFDFVPEDANVSTQATFESAPFT